MNNIIGVAVTLEHSPNSHQLFYYVASALHSSDLMAWSFAAWKQGRNPNNWREARAYCDRVEEILAA